VKGIILSPPELCFCITVAAQRIATKHNGDRFIAEKITPFASHLFGVMGELGVAKIYGGKVNQSVLKNGDQHIADVILKDGRCVEVKASSYTGNGIELKLHNEELIDGMWYCLARIIFPDKIEVFDLISCDDFKKASSVKDYGYGERLVLRY